MWHTASAAVLLGLAPFWLRLNSHKLTLPMPKGRGFLGCSPRTRHAHPKVKRCDRLTRALDSWLSSPLHRRKFPQALRYCRQSTTRRARTPFIPSPQGRGLLAENDKQTPLKLGEARDDHCVVSSIHARTTEWPQSSTPSRDHRILRREQQNNTCEVRRQLPHS